MATFDDVARIALELPETQERLSRGLRQWRVEAWLVRAPRRILGRCSR